MHLTTVAWSVTAMATWIFQLVQGLPLVALSCTPLHSTREIPLSLARSGLSGARPAPGRSAGGKRRPTCGKIIPAPKVEKAGFFILDFPPSQFFRIAAKSRQRE